MNTHIETGKIRDYILYPDFDDIIVSTTIGTMKCRPDILYHHVPYPRPDWHGPDQDLFHPYVHTDF